MVAALLALCDCSICFGSYCSFSLVIYGNTAEDLGQLSIEVDLVGSLTDTIFSVVGKLEGLPPALQSD
ncbi:hypothetical protein ACSBR2_020590 [Camellia fascicularis]